tara:strand:+ start:429 stop:713 length:285 start_codon:yes stop_codon:yes gene_type:complete
MSNRNRGPVGRLAIVLALLTSVGCGADPDSAALTVVTAEQILLDQFEGWRDTVLIWPQETVDVGVVPLDKGKWLTHCHIQEHAEAGMMTLVEVE